MKGVDKPKYHLGGNFGREYDEKIMETYNRKFGKYPQKKSVPLDDGNHPETNTSPLLSEKDHALYMSLVGSLQWCVTLNRIDITYSVIVMSRFCVEPREGHMACVHQIYGYLYKHPTARLRFRTGIPDCESQFNAPVHNWMHSIYGEHEVEIFDGLPAPKGEPFRIMTFIDSGLHHCKITGKASTGILQYVNQTPVEWSAKKQSTVETTTYGAEFVAARHGVDATIDTAFVLRSFGVNVEEPCWMIGDNHSVVTSSTIPHSQFGKRWLALAYHRVRAAIAHGILRFCHVDSKNNPADILTKALGRVALWATVDPLLFRQGETLNKEQLEALKIKMS